MIIEFFSLLYQALSAKTSQEKCQLTQEIFKNFSKLDFSHQSDIKPLINPTFANFCQIVPPNRVPQGKTLKNDLSFAHLLHCIAHIEFSAIDLALDCAYRFRNLPHHYYKDWIEVAKEEVHHFLLTQKHLKSLGFSYGDFGVHNTLFKSLQKNDILLERIALIPKGMEAIGLDVNPFLYAKVQKSKHPIKTEVLETLSLILDEEITHVAKGNLWFDYCCKEAKIPTNQRAKTYIEILKKHHFSFPKANKSFNQEARLKAGFTKEELKLLCDESFLSSNPK